MHLCYCHWLLLPLSSSVWPLQHPTDVDYRVMATFTEFYTTLLGFVNFKLYHSLNLFYPPKVYHQIRLSIYIFTKMLVLYYQAFFFFFVKLDGTTLDVKENEEDYAMTTESYIEVGFWRIYTNRRSIFSSICYFLTFLTVWFGVQKLSALSSSLARVVSSIEEDEAQLDQFPVEGVRKQAKLKSFKTS